MFQPHLKYTLTFAYTCTSRSRSFITTLFHSSVHFPPVLVNGLYQTESCSLHVMQLIRIKPQQNISIFHTLWCGFAIVHYSISLECFIFFSRSTIQKLENNMMNYCLLIMYTITYAHDITHVHGTGRIVLFDLREWNW